MNSDVDQKHFGNGDKTQKHNTHDSQEVSPFPGGDHKAVRKRHDSTAYTNMKHNLQKRSTKEAHIFKMASFNYIVFLPGIISCFPYFVRHFFSISLLHVVLFRLHHNARLKDAKKATQKDEKTPLEVMKYASKKMK